MKRAAYPFSVLAVAALILTVLRPSLVWLGACLLVLALYSLTAACSLYRPPEDHLGVIYRFDRFERWAPPDEWIVRIPWVDVVRTVVNLQIRQVPVPLPDLVTRDQVSVSCEVMVTYRVDPRDVDRGLISQVVGFSKADWDGIITTTLREVAIQVVARMAFLHLSSVRGLRELKEALGTELSERLRLLGLVIVPRSGVTVQAVRTADAVREVLIQRYAAEPLGAAALARVRPMLTELKQADIDNARNALLLAWGATIVQGASPPSIVVTGAGDGRGNGHGPPPDALSAPPRQGPLSSAEPPTRRSASRSRLRERQSPD
jgi:regulator of protease activity HflC (stomatin/prohibitin superfamily)